MTHVVRKVMYSRQTYPFTYQKIFLHSLKIPKSGSCVPHSILTYIGYKTPEFPLEGKLPDKKGPYVGGPMPYDECDLGSCMYIRNKF